MQWRRNKGKVFSSSFEICSHSFSKNKIKNKNTESLSRTIVQNNIYKLVLELKKIKAFFPHIFSVRKAIVYIRKINLCDEQLIDKFVAPQQINQLRRYL